jgi:hypothetical protein
MVFRSFRMPWLTVACCALSFAAARPAFGQETQPDSGSGTDTDVVRPPVEYVMAAPRAAIVTPLRNTGVRLSAYGAAFNFPRRNGSLTISVGTTVVFRDGLNMEGVWYDRTYGHLATFFELQILDPTSSSNRWITLGRDGARAVRSGASIGTADVRVRHRFDRPGAFALRAIIRTLAVPLSPDGSPVVAVSDNQYAAKVEDTVYVKVEVVDRAVDVSMDTVDPTEEALAALAADAEDPALPPPPPDDGLRRLEYVVAAPRGAIVPPPQPTTVPWPLYGAAFNFPRPNGSLTVPVGAAVVFRESRNMEGIWYPHTFGNLATSLELQMLDPTGSTEEWVTIGRDGARDTRKGPSIGAADVKVPHRFEQAGEYALRAIIRSNAVPMNPATDPATVTNAVGISAHAENIIAVRVKVVDPPVVESATTDDPINEVALAMEADAQGTGVLQMGAQINAPVPAPADMDDDGDVDGFDFLTFANCFGLSSDDACRQCDQDADGDVDGFDFLTFANCFNGADRPPHYVP